MKPHVIDREEGYSYGKWYTVKGGTVYRCNVRPKGNECAATIAHKGNAFIPGKHPHTCPPNPFIATYKRAYADAKKIGDENLFSSGKDLALQVLKNIHEEDPQAPLPKVKNVTDSLNHHRATKRPKNPRKKISCSIFNMNIYPKSLLSHPSQ